MNPPIHPAMLQQHIAILGKTGSGKTSTCKLAIEQVVAAGARVCVMDPIKSDWWGLTSSSDGKRPGLPFHILGGPRGHVPLHAQAGAAIGEIVANGSLPLSILDMSDFEMGGLQQFFTHFAPMLLRKMRGVLYLVVEEAHEFAPKERAGFGLENMAIHYAKKLAVAGRSKGIRILIATQRTQSLHNAMLGSCDTLIAHRMTAPADQEPIIKWLKANLPPEKAREVAASLQSLKTGEAWICSGELGLFERRQFPRITTYDNTATPTSDIGAVEVKTAPVDHDRLRAIIGHAVEDAKANDPAQLKRRIVELEKRLSAAPVAPAPATRVVEKAIITDADRDLVAKAISVFSGYPGAFEATMRHAGAVLEELKLLGRRMEGASSSVRPAAPCARPTTRMPSLPKPPRAATNGHLPKGERAILVACAQYAPTGGATREQLTILTGYKRSSRDAYLQRLRERGYTEDNGTTISPTTEGVAALGDFTPLPTGEALRGYWLARLPAGERRIFEVLLNAYPQPVSREDIDQHTGYQRSSRDAYLQRMSARRIVSFPSRGAVVASDLLF